MPTDMPDSRPQRVTSLQKQAGVAALYALLMFLDTRYLEGISAFTPFEPGSGLAIAVLLIGGMYYAWGVLIGGILGNMTEMSFLPAAITSSADALGALGAAWLLARGGDFDPALRSLRDYLRLVSSSAISIAIAGGIWGMILLAGGFIPPGEYFHELIHWWLGDMLGIVLIAPLVLVCWLTRGDRINKRQWGEFALLLGLIFLAGQVIFFGWLHESLSYLARGYVMFLFVIWVAMRLGTRGTVIVLNMIGIHALSGAYHGVGYFANDTTKTHLTDYWLYMVALSMVGMALATFLAGLRQTEKALRRSETKYRTLYDSTNDAVMLLDEKGFFDCNKATLEMIGCATKEEFCTKHPADLSPPEQPCGTSSFMLANQYIATAMKEGGCRFEWVSRRLDTGKIFVADVLLSAIELEGRLVVQAVIRDITEQKRAEAALRQSEAMLKESQRIAHLGSWQLDIATNRILWSDELYFMLGLDPAKPPPDYTDSAKLFTPESWERLSTAIARTSESGVPYELVLEMTRHDGRHGWMLAHGEAVRDASGSIVGIRGTAADITERKQIELALRESEERLRSILNNASAVIFIKDTAGRYLFVNSLFERLFHVSSVAIQGKTDYDLFPKDRAEAFIAADNEVYNSGAPIEFEECVPQDDGIHNYISVKFPLRDSSGDIYAVCGIATDITKIKTGEQRLRNLAAHILDVREEEKNRIAREIHDELGSTLTALNIDTHWLARKLASHDSASVVVERLRLMSQRIDSAVSATRRIIDNMRPAVLDDLGLLAAIEWLAEDFHMRTDIKCQVKCIEDEANLDEQRSVALFRILQEALTNVLRHSGASEVKIEYSNDGNRVALTVSDNGRGMAGSSMATSKSYGMLGMTERVEQLGGRIVFSCPQGSGLRVEVTLPLTSGRGGIQ